MFARAALAILLIALAFAGRASAQDVPACAQYQEPMVYNACLARHGPKANDIATRPAYGQHGRSTIDRAERARTATAENGTRPRRHGRVRMEFPVK